MTAGVAALLAGMNEKDIAIVISTATVAVENNFAKSAEKAGQEIVEEEAEADIDPEREIDEILGKSSGCDFAAAGSETFERERPLSPASLRMMDSIEILDEAIKEEQRSRVKKDVGFVDDYFSRAREMALRQELATAQQLYQGRQTQKALGRIAGGSWTTDDLLTAGTPFVFGAVGAITGAKGGRVLSGPTTRQKLFGTDKVASFKAGRVRPVNGQMPINSEYAGKIYTFNKLPASLKAKYPNLQRDYQHGIPFTGTGHPDFSRYAAKIVKVEFTGFRWRDELLANRAAGLDKKPSGFTWHHHQDGKTMLLVPRDIHDAIRHSGGMSTIKSMGK